MKFSVFAALVVLLSAAAVLAADYEAKSLNEPPGDQVAADVRAQISPAGYKVLRGGTRTVCEIWLRKELPIESKINRPRDIAYPLEVGELVGVVRYKRKTTDFHDQEIGSGTYTLRYGLQPVDGNHVGTSLTRDFLLLLPADADRSPQRLSQESMFKFSKQAAGTKHPAILYLVRPQPATEMPAVRHLDPQDWWTLQIKVSTGADSPRTDLPLEFVVAGSQEG